jgi:plasmid stabilization system protein ParE
MEERKRVLLSAVFETDLQIIFEYGFETFGLQAAEKYRLHMLSLAYKLEDFYLMYPECRWLSTKGRIYRNIILESHLIIYRIKEERVEVLRALHSKSSISRIRTARSIKV